MTPFLLKQEGKSRIICLVLLTWLLIQIAQGQSIEHFKENFLALPNDAKIVWLNKELKKDGIDESSEAWLWHQLGNQYYSLSEIDTAIVCTEKALKIRQKLSETDAILVSTFNLGLYHAQKEQLEVSNHYFKKLTRPINRKSGVAYFQWGRNHLKQNDIHQAQFCFSEAIKQPPFLNNIDLQDQILLELTEFLLETQFPEHLDSAKVYLDKMRQRSEQQMSSTSRLLLLNRLGLWHSYHNALDSALWYWQKANALNQQCCDDQQMTSDLTTNRAIIRRKMGQPGTALQLHFQAQNLLTSESHSLDSAIIQDNIVRCYLDLDSLNHAREYSDRALKTLGLFNPMTAHGLDTTRLPFFPYKNELVKILLERSELFDRISEPKTSLAILEFSIQLVHDLALRTSKLTDQLKLKRLGQRVYSKILDHHIQSQDKEGLVSSIESSKNVILNWHALSNHSDTIRKMNDRIIRLEKEDFENKSNSNITEILELSAELKSELNNLSLDPFISKSVLDQLEDDKDYIIYSTDPHRCIAVHLQKGIIVDDYIINSETLIENIQQFYQACSDLSIENRENILRKQGRILFDQLIAPFTLTKRDLVIIPDGYLHLLPFGALLDEDNKYLIHTKNISYATSLGHATTDVAGPIKNVACIHPKFQEGEKLNHVNRELTAIENYFKHTEINTDSTIMDQLSEKDFDAIHFGTHGGVGKSDPEYGYIFVGPTQKLYIREIWGQPIHKALVVVGACESGKGEIFENEGQLSLGEAFVSAGCPNVIQSKWRVDDYAGSKILAGMYEHLSKEYHLSQSLQLSTLEYLRKSNLLLQDPYYWAGWTAYQGRQSESKNTPNWFLYLFLILLGITLLMFYQLRHLGK